MRVYNPIFSYLEMILYKNPFVRNLLIKFEFFNLFIANFFIRKIETKFYLPVCARGQRNLQFIASNSDIETRIPVVAAFRFLFSRNSSCPINCPGKNSFISLSFLFFFIFFPSIVLQITHLENSLYVTYLQGTRSDTEYNLKSSGMLFDQNFVWKGLWTRFIKDHVSITFSISILCIFKRKDIYAVSTFERYLYLRYLDPMGILFIAADKKDCTFVKIKNKLISWLFIFLEIGILLYE